MYEVSNWFVKLAEGVRREFIDLRSLTKEYYQLQEGYIEKLQNRINEQPSYTVKTGIIHSVRGPSDSLLAAPFILLLVTTTGLTAGFLGSLQDDGGVIVGVWPKQFRSLLETRSEAIVTLLYAIVEKPDIVQTLQLIF